MCIDIWQEESVRCVCGWVRDQKANTMDLESCRLGFFLEKIFFFEIFDEFESVRWRTADTSCVRQQHISIWLKWETRFWLLVNYICNGNASSCSFIPTPFPPITLKCCQIKCDSLYQKQFTLQNKSLETFETFSDSFIWFSKVYQINRRLGLHVDGCQQQFWHGNFTFKPTGRLEWFDIWAMFISDLFSNLMLKMENWIYWLRKVK